jgi:hypothetical protein
MSFRVVYLQGWIKRENMDNPDWFETWLKSAAEAEANNVDLVVFKIPRASIGKANDTVKDIELFLQERFGVKK